MAGLDMNAISLAVSAGSAIKIFQAVKPTEDKAYQFQEVLEIEVPGTSGAGAATTIHSLAWAPGPMRPYYAVAAACDDSTVRIFDMHVTSSSLSLQPQQAPNLVPRLSRDQSAGSRPSRMPRRSSALSRNAPSGIGAGLAEMTKGATADRKDGPISITYEWKQSAVLWHGHNVPVRKVLWVYDGKSNVLRSVWSIEGLIACSKNRQHSCLDWR